MNEKVFDIEKFLIKEGLKETEAGIYVKEIDGRAFQFSLFGEAEVNGVTVEGVIISLFECGCEETILFNGYAFTEGAFRTVLDALAIKL